MCAGGGGAMREPGICQQAVRLLVSSASPCSASAASSRKLEPPCGCWLPPKWASPAPPAPPPPPRPPGAMREQGICQQAVRVRQRTKNSNLSWHV
jgi:hypothetical protein